MSIFEAAMEARNAFINAFGREPVISVTLGLGEFIAALEEGEKMRCLPELTPGEPVINLPTLPRVGGWGEPLPKVDGWGRPTGYIIVALWVVRDGFSLGGVHFRLEESFARKLTWRPHR